MVENGPSADRDARIGSFRTIAAFFVASGPFAMGLGLLFAWLNYTNSRANADFISFVSAVKFFDSPLLASYAHTLIWIAILVLTFKTRNLAFLLGILVGVLDLLFCVVAAVVATLGIMGGQEERPFGSF